MTLGPNRTQNGTFDSLRLTEQVRGCPDLLVLLVDLDDPTVVDRMDDLTYPWSAALVRKLLARGLDPNRPDWLGETFLHACAASGNRSVAAVLLDTGADIIARGLEFNETP